MFRALLIVLLMGSAIAAEPSKEDNLEAIVLNMRSPEELVCQEIHPATYLGKLRVNPPKEPLSHLQRYILARHLLDCSHLCDVLHHQSFDIPGTAPVMRLAEATFPGFREACMGEGGYNTHLFFRYFEKHGDVWRPG